MTVSFETESCYSTTCPMESLWGIDYQGELTIRGN